MKTAISSFLFLLFSVVAVAQENSGPYTPDENKVLLMHFDGDATNSAGVGNNGIVHGSGVSYETGVHGQALRLDNTNSDKQSGIELPFFDDFSNDYENWTSYSITGDDQWHLSGDDGIDGGKCARFYITSNPPQTNDDWLVSKMFNTESVSNIAIEFKFWYHGEGMKPEFYYTTSFTGDVATTNWKELDNSFWKNEWTWNDARIEIENPGNTLVFALRYQSTTDNSEYILLDNFSVSEYELGNITKAGETENFEFYTDDEENTDYWLEIREALETAWSNYISLWYRTDFDPIFPYDGKIKINYYQRKNFPANFGLKYNWDCGSFDSGSGIIYLAPLETDIQKQYYGNFSSLAINEFAQLAVSGKLNEPINIWQSEGFGLYEMGYRPVRKNLLHLLDSIGTNEPDLTFVEDISELYKTGNKDLMTSLFESEALLSCYYYYDNFLDVGNWIQLLKHYYIKDIDRIKLILTTEHFNFYGAEKEIPFVDALGEDMEEQLELQENRFEEIINHKVNVCIYDNEVGKEINNRTDFQGLACGADKINTSHLEIGDYGLMHHEFMHSWVNILSNHNPGPGQFLNEGLAESTDRFMQDQLIPSHLNKIEDLYRHYKRKYNRQPTFLEIIDNAEVNQPDGFWVDAYALGELYWRYMNDKYPDNFWIKVKLFLRSGRDWSVFGGKSTDEEGAEFIHYLKTLANLIPGENLIPLPFTEVFSDLKNGWTKPSYSNSDNWLLNERGSEDSSCIHFYTHSDKNEPIESWLISPPLHTKDIEKISLSFDFARYGEGFELDLFYTNKFEEFVDSTSWIPIRKITMPADWGWSNTGKISITNPSDTVFIAIKMNSTGEQHQQLYIDNFNVKEYGEEIPFLSIRQIQGESGTSPYENQKITTKGRIMATNQHGFFIQDTTDIRSGIFVYAPGLEGQFNQGENVQLTAKAKEYNGKTELLDVDSIKTVEEQISVYLLKIAASQLGEDYEGVFVDLEGLTVVYKNQFDEYMTVSAEGDSVLIDNLLIQPELEIGSTYNIAGIVDYTYGSYRLNPRGEAGIRLVETGDLAITPFQAAAQIKVGINLGNTLEPPLEGGWNNPPAEESYFEAYKSAGFDLVRVPVRWDNHMSATAPFAIDEAWLNRVEEVVDWGLSRDLFIVINAHHEDWIKENYEDPNMRVRFDSLWSQVATRFKDKSEKLFFEILNEPTTHIKGLTVEENNELHQRALSIIRKNNPTRIVIFQGNNWGGAWDLIQAAIPDDDYLMGSFHSYSPYEFALLGEGIFDQEAYNIVQNEFIAVKNWSDANNIPVFLGEFGSLDKCDYNSRMKQYNAYVTLSQQHNVIPCVWDSGIDFVILNRQDGTWHELKDLLIYTFPDSPDKLNLSIEQDSLVKLSWINICTEATSIKIQRRNSLENEYLTIASIDALDNEYLDKPNPDFTYHYRIVAYVNDTVSKFSAPQKIYLPIFSSSEVPGITGTFNNWGNYGPDIAMTANVNTPNTWSVEYNFTNNEEVKFRNNNKWEKNWSDSNFPEGTGIQNGNAIPVPKGNYLIVLNTETGAYSFQPNLKELRIKEIQGDSESSPYVGIMVKTTGNIIAINSKGFYLQDSSGVRSGIYVYSPGLDNQLFQGDVIEITAQVDEYQGKTELLNVVEYQKLEKDLAIYLADIMPAEMGEDYEGVFVDIKGLTVVYKNQFNEYMTVSAEGDSVLVDNFLMQPEMEIGKSYNVAGIVDYAFRSYRLNPRAQNGIREVVTEKIPNLSIRQIQGKTDISPFNNQKVSTLGRIMAVNQHGFFLQDTTNIRSGIFVYAPELKGQYNQGDRVQLTATVNEYFGKTQLMDIDSIKTIDEQIPIYLSYINSSQLNEDYEGVFVNNDSLKVIYKNAYDRYMTVSKTGDSVMVDNFLIQPEMEIGLTYNVAGIVDFRNNSFRINPRAQAGIREVIISVNVEFFVNLKNEEISANGIFVAGDWDNWAQAIPMNFDGSVYSASVQLTANESYEYKFVNGTYESKNLEEIAAGKCISSGTGNRVLTVLESNIKLDIACFSSCENCRNLPYLVQVPDTIFVYSNQVPLQINLKNYVADDDPNAFFTFEIESVSNSALVSASCSNNMLNLSFYPDEKTTVFMNVAAHSDGDMVQIPFCIVIKSTTGIENPYSTTSISVYPNPVKKFLFVKGIEETPAKLVISYIDGRIERRESLFSENFTVDVSQLSPGIYFISLQSKNRSSTVRFIKQ